MSKQLPNMSCTICRKIDDFSKSTGKCIFHCQKNDWFNIDNNCKRWDIEKIKRFWDELKKEKIDKEDYNFFYFIFPKFLNKGLLQFKNKKNEIIFYNSEFLDDADFGAFGPESSNAINFYSNAIFEKTIFHKNATFFRSKFFGRTTFKQSEFNGDVDFSQSNFKGSTVDFTQTMFNNSVDFHSAHIEPLTTFTLTSVKNKIDFSAVKFNTVYFLDCEFQNIKFWGTRFRENAVFSNIHFKNAVFQKTDLNNVFFSSTMEIEKIPFLECNFPEYKNRKIVFNEKIKREKNEGKYIGNVLLGIHFTYEENENVYRRLKKSFEERKDYEIAGDFYMGEMEMRRKKFATEIKNLNKSNNLFIKIFTYTLNWMFHNTARRFLLFWYWLFSDYGERPGKVLRYILFFIFIFALLFFWSFDFSRLFILKSIGLSIENFIPLLPKLNLDNISLFQRIIFDIEVFVSSVLWFLLIVSIRQKFKR